MIADPNKIFPQWKLMRCEFLDQMVLIRRPTIGDLQLQVVDMWARLVKDADGTPLFPPSFKACDADPKLVEEICRLATENPTETAD